MAREVRPLKVHAWEEGKDTLMCGFPPTLSSTADVKQVTCAKCLNELDDKPDVKLRGLAAVVKKREPVMPATENVDVPTPRAMPMPRMVVISKPHLELVPPFVDSTPEVVETQEKETTIEKPVHPTLTKGKRVFVPDGDSSRGLTVRTGTIDTVDAEKGGCLVRHDDGSLFGWAWKEMVFECEVGVLTMWQHRLLGLAGRFGAWIRRVTR